MSTETEFLHLFIFTLSLFSSFSTFVSHLLFTLPSLFFFLSLYCLSWFIRVNLSLLLCPSWSFSFNFLDPTAVDQMGHFVICFKFLPGRYLSISQVLTLWGGHVVGHLQVKFRLVQLWPHMTGFWPVWAFKAAALRNVFLARWKMWKGILFNKYTTWPEVCGQPNKTSTIHLYLKVFHQILDPGFRDLLPLSHKSFSWIQHWRWVIWFYCPPLLCSNCCEFGQHKVERFFNLFQLLNREGCGFIFLLFSFCCTPSISNVCSYNIKWQELTILSNKSLHELETNMRSGL